METRIKTVEYGDGRKEYFPEVQHSFKAHIVSMFQSEPFWFIVAFVLTIPIAYLWSLSWDEICYDQSYGDTYDYRSSFDDMETAKKAIDNFILIHETEKAQKASKKLSEKKVKTEILDYP